jgi:hypothetical protein
MTSKFARIIVPTPTQALLSLLLSIVLLGVIFRRHLVALISGSSGVSTSQLQSSYNAQLTRLTHIGFMPALTIGVFWAGVAVVGYVVALELLNLVIGVRNEVVVDTTFINRGPLGGRLGRPLVRVGLAVVFLLYLLLAVQVLLPVWTGWVGQLVLKQTTLGSIESTVGGVVGLAVTIYVGWLLGIILKNFA